MKGYSNWQHTPYVKYCDNSIKREFFITQILPHVDGFTVRFIDKRDFTHKLCYRERGSEKWLISEVFTVTGLKNDVDYEIAVQRSDNTMTEIRLVRTFEPIGTVVNYLHPDDPVYKSSGNHLCSPSVCLLPSGKLLASMDVFGRGTPQNLTLIFESDDKGKSWKYVTELFPCYWGQLFVHRGRVYMFSTSCIFGDVIIGASDDEGKTWTAPVTLFRAANTRSDGWHKSPMPVVEHNGMLYTGIECWPSGFDSPAAAIASCPADADLLDPSNWCMTEPTPLDSSWTGFPQGNMLKIMESNAVVAPDGAIYSILRIDQYAATPSFGSALILKFVDREKPLQFERVIDFPLGSSAKFHIIKVGDLYIAAGNEPYQEDAPAARNLLSLAVSKDLINWKIVYQVVDAREYDMNLNAFQYPFIEVVDDDLVVLSRTAFGGAVCGHDSNQITCHTLKNISKYI